MLFRSLERLRSRPETQALPVLVWTAKDLSAEERARLADAAQAVVSKDADLGQSVVDALAKLMPPPGGGAA